MNIFPLVSDMCTLISSSVNTFDDKPIELQKILVSNCSVLLVADCSVQSRFALFVRPIKNETNHTTNFELELHVDDNVVWYTPHISGNDFIRLQDSTQIEVTTLVTPLGDDVELR